MNDKHTASRMELMVLTEKIDKMRVTTAKLVLQFAKLYTPEILAILQLLNDNSQEKVIAIGQTNINDQVNDLRNATLNIPKPHTQIGRK